MNSIEGNLDLGTGKLSCNKLLKRIESSPKTLQNGATTELAAADVLSGKVVLISSGTDGDELVSLPLAAAVVQALGKNAKAGIGFEFLVHVTTAGTNTDGASVRAQEGSNPPRFDIAVNKSKKIVCRVVATDTPEITYV